MDVEPLGPKAELAGVHRRGDEQFGSNLDWIDVIEHNRGVVTPSSRVNRFSVPAALPITFLPVAVEPVTAVLATSA
jgi:hypothetical protein